RICVEEPDIDIVLIEKNGDLQLVSNHKISKIAELDESHRQQVLTYCDDLLKQHVDHYILNNATNSVLLSDDSFPLPPPEKMLSSRYDGYLPLLLGLYCIKNESTYKTLENRDFEVIFDSFNEFVKKELFDKFRFLEDDYKGWLKRKDKNGESGDLDTYINKVLTRRLRANINKAKKIIEQFDDLYFSI
ncbi:hypothetical protein, partial [Photobacterium sanguinicancri]